MARHALRGGLLWVLVMARLAWAGAAAEAPLRVPRAASPIRVDGVLDEPAWASALTLSLEYETYPGDNLPATLRTECLVLHDERNLYIGVRAFDPDPGAIRAYLADRDSLPGDEDQVQFVLDTFNDQRRAYVFAASPLGVQWDAIASEVGGTGLSYDRYRSGRSTAATTASCARRRRSPASRGCGQGSTSSWTRRSPPRAATSARRFRTGRCWTVRSEATWESPPVSPPPPT